MMNGAPNITVTSRVRDAEQMRRIDAMTKRKKRNHERNVLSGSPRQLAPTDMPVLPWANRL